MTHEAPKRFYLNRTNDETGISRTGRVLEGCLLQSGKVVTEWRPPMSTIGIYNSFDEFLKIHVLCHPSCSEVVWLDPWCRYCGYDNGPYVDGAVPRECLQCHFENVAVGGPQYDQPKVAP